MGLVGVRLSASVVNITEFLENKEVAQIKCLTRAALDEGIEPTICWISHMFATQGYEIFQADRKISTEKRMPRKSSFLFNVIVTSRLPNSGSGSLSGWNTSNC
ncbi:hypothetical protein Trydic_g11062 [Trypoxylus dichotomus]